MFHQWCTFGAIDLSHVAARFAIGKAQEGQDLHTLLPTRAGSQFLQWTCLALFPVVGQTLPRRWMLDCQLELYARETLNSQTSFSMRATVKRAAELVIVSAPYTLPPNHLLRRFSSVSSSFQHSPLSCHCRLACSMLWVHSGCRSHLWSSFFWAVTSTAYSHFYPPST